MALASNNLQRVDMPLNKETNQTRFFISLTIQYAALSVYISSMRQYYLKVSYKTLDKKLYEFQIKLETISYEGFI